MLEVCIMGKSWLTTVVGVAGAVMNLVIAAIQAGAVTPRDIVLSVVLAALGLSSKTFNVTGK
ncbi:MAG: hypothetical protein Q8L64_01910 [bacterium]|nr:hypothetical protein [bacterium]